MKNLYLLILLAASITFLSACGNSGMPANFDYGTVTDDTYSNKFFDMNMSLPADWVVQTQEQTKAILDLGKDMIGDDNKELKKVIDASEVNSANLLMVTEEELGSMVSYNANMVIVAENLSLVPGIRSGEGYLYHSSKLLDQMNMDFTVDKNFKKEIISGQEFYAMDVQVNHLGQSSDQIYYATVKNGFALAVIISYADEAQKRELVDSVKSMKFN